FVLHDLAGQADNLHEVPFAELAGNSTEDARAAGIVFGIDQHDGVGVELHVGAVLAARRAFGAHDHCSNHRLLFDFTAGNYRLEAANEDIAEACRAALRAAEDLDAHHFLRAGV